MIIKQPLNNEEIKNARYRTLMPNFKHEKLNCESNCIIICAINENEPLNSTATHAFTNVINKS